MLMDQYKILEQSVGENSLEMCADESAVKTRDETPSGDDVGMGGRAETEDVTGSSANKIDNSNFEQENSETVAIMSEEKTDVGSEPSVFNGNAANDDGAMAEIESLIKQLSEQVSAMEVLFNKRIMHADYEDKVIDQLHDELQKYKEDLYLQLIRPILLDVIVVCDSIMRNAAIYLGKPEGEQDIPNKMFADYACELQDILEKYNVEIYRSEHGGAFVPVKQRAIKKEITSDESLHGKIAESLSNGYSYEGRVISAEKVSVYFYQES